MLLALEQEPDGDRRQSPRQAVGGEHGEHHREAKRREQISRRAPRNTTEANTQLIASVETSVGTAIPAEPCRVADGRAMPSSVSNRWVFSMVTVELSTKIPTASASPPSVMVLIVSPRKYRQ